MMQLTLLNWISALLPVMFVLVLMLGFRWGGSKAGAVSWFATILISVIIFGAGPKLIAYAQVKSILLALDVLMIVWSALLLFHIADEAGAIAMIGVALPSLSSERTMQALLIGWLFASFLQGFGGLGVPVAVTAPLLIGMGFNPIQSVVMASIGHTWNVTFGSMGSAYQSLLAVTNFPADYLAGESSMLLGMSSLPCGMLVAYLAGGWKGLKRTFPAIIIISAVMLFVLHTIAMTDVWPLAATSAGMVGILTGVILTKIPLFNGRSVTSGTKDQTSPENRFLEYPNHDGKNRSLLVAMSVYIVLIVIAFTIKLIKPINQFVSQVKLSLYFPELQTSLGWITPAGYGRQINIFGHPGAILLYASVVAFAIYAFSGYYKPDSAKTILKKVQKNAITSSLGIIAMVSISVLMSHSGMTNVLAEGLVRVTQRELYPMLSPFIGALGAFITGSNSNSNVLFALLQQRGAELLGLSVPLILAAQTTGASLGSALAPAKVIVGCSTAGLSGKEGLVLQHMLKIGLIPIAIVAIITTVMIFMS